MFQQTPDHRLWLAKQRQAELIHEADQFHLARLARAHGDEPADHPWILLFRTIREGLRRPFASAQRALSTIEAPCSDPCPDSAPS